MERLIIQNSQCTVTFIPRKLNIQHKTSQNKNYNLTYILTRNNTREDRISTKSQKF